MSNNPSPKKPGWKQGGPEAKGSPKAVRDWQKEKGVAGTPAGTSRKLKLLGSVTVLFVLLALVIWLLYFLFLPKKTALVLVVAGYETNLTLPHNAPGRAGIDALRDMAAQQEHAKNFELHSADSDFRDKTDWEPAARLKEIAEKHDVLLVVFSAHGISEGGDNYLLRDGGSPWNLKEHLSLDEVFTALAAVNPKKPKVLVLDVVHMGSNWPTGVIHNQFVTNLKKLNERIKGIPNLVVMCSTDEHQRSWHSPEWGRSVYLQYLLEGLKGAADQDRNNWVSTRELQEFVAGRTQRWVYDNRLELQTPILLPDGEDGLKRSEDMRVVQRTEYREPEPVPANAFSPAGLKPAWEQWQAMRNQTPAPWVYAPHVWTLYCQAVLRYEELLLVGSPKAAEAQHKADEYHKSLESLREVRLQSSGYSLPLAAVGGRHLRRDLMPKMAGWVSKLLSDPKSLDGIQREAGDNSLLSQELHRFLFRREVRQARRLRDKDMTDILNRLEPVKTVRPAEVHFARMLALPSQFEQENLDRPLQSQQMLDALSLRLRAEEVALAFDAGTREHPYAEHLLPWIEARMRVADESPPLDSEDWLFAHRWDQARREADKAGDLYGLIERDVVRLRRALKVRDEAMAELPWLSRYVALLEPADKQKGNEQLAAVRELWKELHELDEELTRPVPENEALLAKQAGDVETLAKRVEDGHQKLRREYGDHFNTLIIENPLPPNLHALHALASVPRLDPDSRERMARKIRGMSQVLLDKNKNSDTNEGKIRESVEGRNFLPRVQERVSRQGTLLAAMVGKPLSRGKLEGYSLKPTEIVFTEASRAGPDVRGIWQQVGDDVQSLLKGLSSKPLEDVRRDARQMEKLGRRLSVASAPQFLRADLNPGVLARNVRLYELLVWMAQRTEQDFWNWEYADAATPYYFEAGRAFLGDARTLLGRLPEADTPQFKEQRASQLNALQQRLESKPKLTLQGLPHEGPQSNKPFLYVTSEMEYELSIQLKVDPAVPRGIPYATFRIGRADLLSQDVQEKRRAAELIKDNDVVTFPMRLYNELLKRQSAHGDPRPGELPRRDTTIGLYSWFRGHINEPVINVALYPYANNVNADDQPLAKAGLTVYGKGVSRPSDNAIVIVLDCSGSMNEGAADDPQRKGRSRFTRTKEALKALLQSLEEETQVSLWIYGQDSAPTYTKGSPREDDREIAEDTIHQLYFQRRWRRSMVDDVMGRVEKIEAKWFTPIVRSILKAKQDLEAWERDPGKGFAAMIILTDGDDTCFEFNEDRKGPKGRWNTRMGDPVLNPGNQLRIDRFLAQELAKSNIQYSLIAYEVRGKERDIAQKQFGGLENALDGKFTLEFTADEEDLKRLLRSGSRRKLKYFIRDQTDRVVHTGDLQGSRTSQPHELLHGDYTVEVRAGGRRITQRVHLEKGDDLTLVLREENGELRLFRDFLTEDFSGKQVKLRREQTGEQWVLTQLKNLLGPGAAEQSVLLFLERSDQAMTASDESLKVLAPGFVWMELRQAQGERGPQRFRWARSQGWPAPAWSISAAWPNEADLKQETRLLVWVSAARPQAEPGTVNKLEHWNLGGTGVSAQRGAAWNRILDGKVRLESVRVEIHPIRFGGEKEPQPRECLVVRAAFDPGFPVFFEPELGLDRVPAAHHYYTEANKYTGYFLLPKSRAESLQQLRLYSVEAFKQRVKAQDLQGTLPLPPPSARAEQDLFEQRKPTGSDSGS